jgi:hypothetical protein
VYEASSGDEFVDANEGPEHASRSTNWRRRPDERRSLLGSTTERVARLADQPVSVLKTAVYGRSHSAAQRSTASNTGASDAPFSVSE